VAAAAAVLLLLLCSLGEALATETAATEYVTDIWWIVTTSYVRHFWLLNETSLGDTSQPLQWN